MEVFSRQQGNKEKVNVYAQEHGFSVCDNFIVSVGVAF
jgi:hypothetical protein